MTTRLDQYLQLEATMLRLDAVDDPSADDVRDQMDVIWADLTTADVAFLDARGDVMTKEKGPQAPKEVLK